MLSSLLSLALTATAVSASAIQPRTLPNSPSGSYTPATVPCPANLSIRSASSGLSQNETAWLSVRRNATIQPMTEFLSRANISGFSASDYIAKVTADPKDLGNLPNIALAMSGGGYRALMNGAGFLSAADSRTPGTTSGPGAIGGLLQSATYLAGLSGGSWLVGSLFANDFVGVSAMLSNGTVWQFSKNIFEGPDAGGILGVVNTAGYWNDIQGQVSGKRDAGFETSITDYWGRALSYQLVGAPDGGPGFVFSGVAAKSEFVSGQTPLPIVVADGRRTGTKVVNGNSTVFEFTPFEMGSFDPTLFGFAPTAYLGTNFSGGSLLASGGRCVQGFDQVGYVMGTSSSLFNEFLLQNLSLSGIPGVVTDAIGALLTEIGDDNNDIAQYVPNPFLGFNKASNPTANELELDLVDGGEDLQNLPLTPLLQPARAVDVIFAVDSSADTDFNWPNGTAIDATYARSQLPIANGTLFPSVPDVNTMVNLGLNNRPTFFGCDVSNFTVSKGQRVPPLLVYVPNAPYTAPSNVSTFDPSYSNAQRDDIIKNGFNGATQGNGTVDAQWATCVACAVLSRSLARTKTAVPRECAACFDRYCWNGTVHTATPPSYQPAFKIGYQATATSGASLVAGSGSDNMVALLVGFLALMLTV